MASSAAGGGGGSFGGGGGVDSDTWRDRSGFNIITSDCASILDNHGKRATDQNCPICLENLETFENLEISDVILTKCCHLFHKKCLDGWRKTGNERNKKCPSCREPLKKKLNYFDYIGRHILEINETVNKSAQEKEDLVKLIKQLPAREIYNLISPRSTAQPLLPLQLFIDNGAHVDSKDNDGWTPLFFACQSNNLAVAGLLLKAGADVNWKDNDGMSTLHWASRNGQVGIAEFLLAKGADVNCKDNNESTPLHEACQNSNMAIAELLLSNDAHINEEDNNGFTPLQVAGTAGNAGIAEFLVSKGATNPTSIEPSTNNGHIGGGYGGWLGRGSRKTRRRRRRTRTRSNRRNHRRRRNTRRR